MRVLFILLALMLTALPLRAAEITVFAASSLRGPLDQIAAAYERRSGDRVRISYAGSAALARQIRQGAPADLFIAASPHWVDFLTQEGLTRPDARWLLLSNRLVVVAPADRGVAEADPADALAALPAGDRLAIGTVTAVPAGIYAQQALAHLGLWEALSDRLAQTDDVRQALALVALGEAPLGIVYASDAQAEPRVQIRAHIAPVDHDPIHYPLVQLTTAPSPEAAARFAAALRSPEAAAIFTAAGFTLPAPLKHPFES